MAVTHYLEALDLQKQKWVKIHTIFGGKNPHPNYLVGGVPCAINSTATAPGAPITMERLNFVEARIERDDRVQPERLHARRAGDRHDLQGAGWLHGGGLSGRTSPTTAPTRRCLRHQHPPCRPAA